jgi:hypothetical protein
MRGPTSCRAVLVMDGKLVVVDGRGFPWVWVGDDQSPSPPSADTAFYLNDKIIAISGGVAWQYSLSDHSGWIEGVAVNEPAPDQEEGPWQHGPQVETKKPAEEEPAPAPTSKRKAKEPA